LTDVIISHEMTIRLGFFFGIFLLMTVWETLSPQRPLTTSKWIRWSNNIGLVFLNSFIIRLLFPAAAVGMATLATSQGWGVLHYYSIPYALGVVIAVITLDFVIYIQHIMVHAVPLLWRLHRVHHADLDYDVTTGARFHPIEITLSMLIKFAAIILLGPPVIAVVLFEVLLNATAMFNHSNVKIPINVDRVLRRLIVTPDMHRVHHSIEDDETNSNFGFSLPWWDRLFGTYRDQPRAGHDNMTIGIHHYRNPQQVSWLPGMLILPFRKRIAGYVINRREWEHTQNTRENTER
jgi:sterol desaturase/sphingolipid hydroxylase (fatty acid hydroxylase superfamily)